MKCKPKSQSGDALETLRSLAVADRAVRPGGPGDLRPGARDPRPCLGWRRRRSRGRGGRCGRDVAGPTSLSAGASRDDEQPPEPDGSGGCLFPWRARRIDAKGDPVDNFLPLSCHSGPEISLREAMPWRKFGSNSLSSRCRSTSRTRADAGAGGWDPPRWSACSPPTSR